jgi:hypothetical protein
MSAWTTKFRDELHLIKRVLSLAYPAEGAIRKKLYRASACIWDIALWQPACSGCHVQRSPKKADEKIGSVIKFRPSSDFACAVSSSSVSGEVAYVPDALPPHMNACTTELRSKLPCLRRKHRELK